MFSKILKLYKKIDERTNVTVRGQLNKDLSLIRDEVLNKNIKTYEEFQDWLSSYYGMDFWKIMNSSPIFNQKLYDNFWTSALLKDLLAPTAPEVYRKYLSNIRVNLESVKNSSFNVKVARTKDNKEYEIMDISLNVEDPIVDREKILVHELEHVLQHITSPEFTNKSYNDLDYSKLIIKVETPEQLKKAFQDMKKAKDDYEKLPLEKVANANTLKRLLAQQHFKSPKEFWDKIIAPELNKNESVIQKSPILINPSLQEIKKLIYDISRDKRLTNQFGDTQKQDSLRFVVTKDNYYVADARDWVHRQILKEFNINPTSTDYFLGGLHDDGYLWFYKYQFLADFMQYKRPIAFLSDEEVKDIFKSNYFYKIIAPLVTEIEYS